MTTLAVRPGRPQPPVEEPRTWAPERPLLTMGLIGVALLMMAVGVVFRGLVGNTLVHGVFMGGVALLILAPFARNALDVISLLSPFMTYMFVPGGYATMGSSDALLPFVIGSLVIGAALTPVVRRQPWSVSPAHVLIVVSVVLVTASIAVHTVLDPGFLTTRAIVDTAKVSVGVVYFVVVFLLVKKHGQAAVDRAFWIWTWTASALSLGSLVGVTGAIVVVPTDGFRSNGFFEDPNLYAGYLLVSFSIMLYLATISKSVWLPVQGLLMAGGIVMTGSRGGLGSLVLLVLFALVVIRSARLRGMLLGIIGLGTLVLGFLLANRGSGTTILGIDRIFFAQDVGDDPRVRLWARAIEKWADSPVWGIGAGQFERFSGDVFRVAKSTGFGYVTHNTFLYFLVAFGIIGLGLFLAMMGWVVARLYAAPGLSRNAKHALLSGVVVLCSQFMTLNLQNLRYVWVYFGLLLGLAAVAQRKPDDEAAERPR
jgi:O-antigen ligase